MASTPRKSSTVAPQVRPACGDGVALGGDLGGNVRTVRVHQRDQVAQQRRLVKY
jgi:hypothetical protein